MFTGAITDAPLPYTEPAEEWTPSGDYSLYYGYNALETAENGKAMQYAYDKICCAVNASETHISFNDRRFSLDAETFGQAYLVYCYDHPEHFWLDQSSYSKTSASDGTLREIVFTYLFEGAELETAKNAMQDAIDALMEDLPTDDTGAFDAYTLELYVHDRIVESVSYEDESEISHTAYGALINKKAVCEGYAKAFQLIMQSYGMPCYMVVGEGREDTHGWDLVKIGDDWCYVDPTWDDTDGDYIPHAFFNMTTEMMLRLRTPYESPFELPLCNNEELYYYRRSEETLHAPFDVNLLSEKLRNGNGSMTMAVDSDEAVEELVQFINDHFIEIAEGAGYQNTFSASYHLVDREIHLTIET